MHDLLLIVIYLVIGALVLFAIYEAFIAMEEIVRERLRLRDERRRLPIPHEISTQEMLEQRISYHYPYDEGAGLEGVREQHFD